MINQYQEQFDTTLFQFLDEIKRMFPETPMNEIKLKLSLGKTLYNKTNAEIFLNNAKEYETEILNEDERALLNLLNSDMLSRLRLNYYYDKLNDSNKEMFWRYIKTLYLLSIGFDKTKA